MDRTYSGFLRTQEKFYTCGEEIANAISHGLAVVASIVGLIFLILYGIRHGNALAVTTFSIFGSSLIVLYLASTLYHAIPNVRAKRALQYVDHSCIFLLIAGTYTPFMLDLHGLLAHCRLRHYFPAVADEEKRQAQHLSVSFSGLAGSVCF